MMAWCVACAADPGTCSGFSFSDVEELVAKEELNGYGIMAPSGPQVPLSPSAGEVFKVRMQDITPF